ncbi:MAG: UDP-3-O-(3-hydroxymyristoyl)glucosamine N-acyltransferase [Elusimicrobiota bacterium]|nr:UDP-3-O-(3-hydroxymyristoyl)glucosamine N-acyltransferase [Elusimicrobiota bacterium]
MNITLAQIAELIHAELKGDGNFIPSGLCGLDDPKEGAVAYTSTVEKPDNFKNLNIGALIAPAKAKEINLPFGGNILYAENPEWAFTLLLRQVDTLNKNITPGVHPKAFVSDKATIGKNVFIGANATVEEGAKIGDNTIIYPNAYIGRNVEIGMFCIIYPNAVIREDCILKNKVILQAGAVIGADGFGYIFHNGKHEKIPQIGNVILEDDVEVGANTTIDRAKINSTIIGANTKVDNLVQIGHNVKIGKASIIISQSGIAGSTQIGNGVIVAGQAGVSGHIKIGDGAVIGPKTGVMGSVKAGDKVMGIPARPYAEFMKVAAISSKLPALYKDFLALKKTKKKFSFFTRKK